MEIKTITGEHGGAFLSEATELRNAAQAFVEKNLQESRRFFEEGIQKYNAIREKLSKTPIERLTAEEFSTLAKCVSAHWGRAHISISQLLAAAIGEGTRQRQEGDLSGSERVRVFINRVLRQEDHASTWTNLGGDRSDNDSLKHLWGLARRLVDPDPAERIKAMAPIAVRDASLFFLALEYDENASVRAEIAKRVVTFEPKDLAPYTAVFRRRLQTDPDHTVRAHAVSALAYDEEARGDLIAALKDPDPVVRGAAARHLWPQAAALTAEHLVEIMSLFLYSDDLEFRVDILNIFDDLGSRSYLLLPLLERIRTQTELAPIFFRNRLVQVIGNIRKKFSGDVCLRSLVFLSEHFWILNSDHVRFVEDDAQRNPYLFLTYLGTPALEQMVQDMIYKYRAVYQPILPEAARIVDAAGGNKVLGEGILRAMIRLGDAEKVEEFRRAGIFSKPVPDVTKTAARTSDEAVAGGAGKVALSPAPSLPKAPEMSSAGNELALISPLKKTEPIFPIAPPDPAERIKRPDGFVETLTWDISGETLYIDRSQLLGKGNYEVYLGFLESADGLGEYVGIKIAEDPAEFPRLERQRQVQGSVRSPRIVRIIHMMRMAEQSYLVMEAVQGMTLRELISAHQPGERYTLPMMDAIELVYQVAMALKDAHEAGVIHRDLKPENVLITPGGYVKLTDLEPWGSKTSPSVIISKSLTSTEGGAGTIGTTRYLAPEVLAGRTVDHRTDIYNLGQLFFETLTGVFPEGRDQLGLYLKIQYPELGIEVSSDGVIAAVTGDTHPTLRTVLRTLQDIYESTQRRREYRPNVNEVLATLKRVREESKLDEMRPAVIVPTNLPNTMAAVLPVRAAMVTNDAALEPSSEGEKAAPMAQPEERAEQRQPEEPEAERHSEGAVLLEVVPSSPTEAPVKTPRKVLDQVIAEQKAATPEEDLKGIVQEEARRVMMEGDASPPQGLVEEVRAVDQKEEVLRGEIPERAKGKAASKRGRRPGRRGR
ncbi:MAG: protein kinase [Deltaproteobacteria bacterium]|nr:protein kinase [Deltaproteobacteria bacterium]